MRMPSYKEAQALRDAAAAIEFKRKQLLARNKEAARALLQSIEFPQVSSITKIVPKQNVDS